MDLPSFNYSIGEHNGQIYFARQDAKSPKKSTLETLRKIEKYITENWQYTTDATLLSQHPNPWPNESIRDRLPVIARTIYSQDSKEARSWISSATRYLKGEARLIDQTMKRINCIMRLLSQPSGADLSLFPSLLQSTVLDAVTFSHDQILAERLAEDNRLKSVLQACLLNKLEEFGRFKKAGVAIEKFSNARNLEEIIHKLIELSEPENLEDALEMASEINDLKILDHLTKRGARYKGGDTPMHLAFRLSSVVQLRSFVDRGANVNATNRLGLPAFFLSKDPEMLKLAIDNGARINDQFKMVVSNPFGAQYTISHSFLTYHPESAKFFDLLIQYPNVLTSNKEYFLKNARDFDLEFVYGLNLANQSEFWLHFDLNSTNSKLLALLDRGIEYNHEQVTKESNELLQKHLQIVAHANQALRNKFLVHIFFNLRVGMHINHRFDPALLEAISAVDPRLFSLINHFCKTDKLL